MTDGVRRFAVVATALAVGSGLAAVTGFAATGGASGEPAPAGFRLEDGSAGCRFLPSGDLACRAAGGETAAVLAADGDSRPDDVEVAWDESTPVLLAAESWWHADVRCSAASGALTCTRAGGSIVVEPEGVGGIR